MLSTQMETKCCKGSDDLLCQLSGGNVGRDIEDKDVLAPCTSSVHLRQQSPGIVLADVPGSPISGHNELQM